MLNRYKKKDFTKEELEAQAIEIEAKMETLTIRNTEFKTNEQERAKQSQLFVEQSKVMKDFTVLYLREGISFQVFEKAFAHYKMFAIKIGPTLIKKLLSEGHTVDEMREQIAPTVSQYFVNETQTGDCNIVLEILDELARQVDAPALQSGIEFITRLLIFTSFNKALVDDSASKNAFSLWFKILMRLFSSVEKNRKENASHKVRLLLRSIKYIMEGIIAYSN